MSRKRQATSRDNYYQTLVARNIEYSVHVFNEEVIALPIPRVASANGKAWCFEILRIAVTPTFVISVAASMLFEISTIHQTAIFFHDPRVILRYNLLGSAAAAGSFEYEPGKVFDYEVADRGLLIGTDTLYTGLLCAGNAALAAVDIMISYRLTQVPQSEFIGILQSQQ